MGFLGELFSGVVKVALTPLAIVKDGINVVSGEEPNTTKELLKSAANDVINSTEELADGNFL